MIVNSDKWSGYFQRNICVSVKFKRNLLTHINPKLVSVGYWINAHVIEQYLFDNALNAYIIWWYEHFDERTFTETVELARFLVALFRLFRRFVIK